MWPVPVGPERARPGVGRRAAERCVDQRDAIGGEPRREFHRHRRIRGGAVDDEERPPRRCEPVGPLDHAAHLRRAGHAEEHDVARLRDFARRRDLVRPERDKSVDRRTVAVRHDGQRPALGQNVGRHALPHQTEPDEADPLLRHHFSLLAPPAGGADTTAEPLPDRSTKGPVAAPETGTSCRATLPEDRLWKRTTQRLDVLYVSRMSGTGTLPNEGPCEKGRWSSQPEEFDDGWQ
jgi:hypothetical protein